MAVTFDWYNDKKSIVRFKFSDPWMVQEMSECERQVRTELMTLNHVVDAIFDFTHGSVLPKNALSYFTSSIRKGESIENEGVTVIFGANMLVKMIGNSIQKVSKTDTIYFVNNLEEAEATLATIKNNRNLH